MKFDVFVQTNEKLNCQKKGHFLTLCFTQHLKIQYFYNTTIKSHKTLITFTFVLKHYFTSFIFKSFHFFSSCWMIVILLSIKVISLSIRAWSRATCCDYFWRRWCKSEEECQYFIIWQILWKGPQLHCWYKNNLAFIPKSQLFLN